MLKLTLCELGWSTLSERGDGRCIGTSFHVCLPAVYSEASSKAIDVPLPGLVPRKLFPNENAATGFRCEPRWQTFSVQLHFLPPSLENSNVRASPYIAVYNENRESMRNLFKQSRFPDASFHLRISRLNASRFKLKVKSKETRYGARTDSYTLRSRLVCRAEGGNAELHAIYSGVQNHRISEKFEIRIKDDLKRSGLLSRNRPVPSEKLLGDL
jgi:hypothetical protein